MEIAWIAAAFMVALASVAVARLPPLHPGQLWTVPWSVAMVLYALHLLPYRDLRVGTAALIVLAGAAFTSAAWWAGRHAAPEPPAGSTSSISRRLWLSTVALLVLTVLGAGLFVAQVTERFGLRSALVTSPEVRIAVEGGTMAVAVKYVYFAFATALLAGISAARGPTKALRMASAVVIPAVGLTTYFSTSRSNIVLAVIIGSLAYLAAREGGPTLRQIATSAGVAVVVGIAALSIGGSIIGKTFEASELSTIDSSFTRHNHLETLAGPYQYATASVAALNELVAVSKPVGGDLGCATVPLVCDLGGAAGLGTSGTNPLRPFTAQPLRWNTYTGLDAPLMDGGRWLAIPIVMLLGVFAGGAWARARTGSVSWLVLYVMLGAAAITSTGQNRFFAYHYVGATLIALITWHGMGMLATRREPREAAL